MVEALFAALSHRARARAPTVVAAARSSSVGGPPRRARTMCNMKSSVAERADGPATMVLRGTTVNQSNAKIAPIEIIESEFPTRIRRFELICDSGGAGNYRGGLGSAGNMSIWPTRDSPFARSKHVIPPHGVQGGGDGRTGESRSTRGRGEKHLPTRYADYPLRAGDRFLPRNTRRRRLGDPHARGPQKVLTDVAKATCRGASGGGLRRGGDRGWPR